MNSIKIILVICVTFFVSCQKSNQPQITLINPEEMKTLLEEEEVQLVDVRTVKEFNEHYIPGAENIVFDDNFELKLDNLDKEKPIVVYCRKGRRSTKCAEILQEKGFKKIYNLKGGITQWMKEGNAVE
jgi:rhodanese-related sulfurtransferase